MKGIQWNTGRSGDLDLDSIRKRQADEVHFLEKQGSGVFAGSRPTRQENDHRRGQNTGAALFKFINGAPPSCVAP